MPKHSTGTIVLLLFRSSIAFLSMTFLYIINRRAMLNFIDNEFIELCVACRHVPRMLILFPFLTSSSDRFLEAVKGRFPAF